jgi:hypothetical protein
MTASTRKSFASQPQPDRCLGLKQIAAYLGCSIRTVQRWQRELALPVRRGGNRSGCMALKSELDDWVRGCKRRAAPGRRGSRISITKVFVLPPELHRRLRKGHGRTYLTGNGVNQSTFRLHPALVLLAL